MQAPRQEDALVVVRLCLLKAAEKVAAEAAHAEAVAPAVVVRQRSPRPLRRPTYRSQILLRR